MFRVAIYKGEITPPDPYNPLNLPANTVRVKTSDGNPPVKGQYTEYESATLVPGTSDVYDVYKSGANFHGFLYNSTNVVEVLGANTTGITDMSSMFSECNILTTVPLFDTSSVTNMSDMLFRCYALTSIPLFDTSNVTNMSAMVNSCYNVESGALALYQQASTQATPPSYHYYCFSDCGRDTVTGAAELAQIPNGWK